MITLPPQALAPRPTARPTHAPAQASAGPDGPSFGDVFERAQQTPVEPASRGGVRDAGEHGPAAGPAGRDDRPQRPGRPGVGERRPGHARSTADAGDAHTVAPGAGSVDPAPDDTALDDTAPDDAAPVDAAPELAAAANPDEPTAETTDETTDEAPVEVPVEHVDLQLAPGASSFVTSGADQHIAAAGLAATGVVEVSNTVDPVAPAGLPVPSLTAMAPTPTAPAAPTVPAAPTASAAPATAEASDTVTVAAVSDAAGDAAPATGPVVTSVRIETVPSDTVAADHPAAEPPPAAAPPAAAPTTATGPAAPAPTEAVSPLVPATTDGAEAADPTTTTTRHATPNASSPATSQAAPPPHVPAAATNAAATPAAGDDAPAADTPTAPARAAATPPAPARGDATVTPGTPAAPTARAAESPLAQRDGVTPSRIADLVERAQRESQIRRAEHTTRIGMDVATEGLGAIRIEATNNGGGLHLNLGAERQATRQLLADQANVLRDELGSSGVDVSVDVSTGRGDGASTHQHDDRRAAGDRANAPSSSSSTIAPTSRTPGRDRSSALHSLLAGRRGVDLHL